MGNSKAAACLGSERLQFVPCCWNIHAEVSRRHFPGSPRERGGVGCPRRRVQQKQSERGKTYQGWCSNYNKTQGPSGPSAQSSSSSQSHSAWPATPPPAGLLPTTAPSRFHCLNPAVAIFLQIHPNSMQQCMSPEFTELYLCVNLPAVPVGPLVFPASEKLPLSAV
ncbi:hypothetical protein VULLAG_LOCUS1066 [Vulpes lagopus]